MKRSRRWIWGLSLSCAAHMGGIGLLWIVAGADRGANAAAEIYRVDLVQRRFKSSVIHDKADSFRPRVRRGDVVSREHSAADSWIRPRAASGARRDGAPSRRARPIAGDDLDDLRYRQLDHLRRYTVQRTQTAMREKTDDNRRVVPLVGAAPHLLSDRGGNRRRVRDPAENPKQITRRKLASAIDPRAGRRDSQSSSSIAQVDRAGVAQAGPQRDAHRAEDGQPRSAFSRPTLDKLDPKVQARRTFSLAIADRRDRDLSSDQRRPDMLDMAKAAGAGSGAGAGDGSEAGRRGDPGGLAEGQAIWLNSTDQRFVHYLTLVRRKLDPLWTFPKDLEVALEQGEALLQFTINVDGSVSGLFVRRSSGFPRFDRNTLAAVRKAAPFARVPASLGGRLTVIAPFTFHNPMVR